MNLAHWLDRSAIAHAARPALCLGERVLADYAGFRDRAAALGAALGALGVAPGDRVAIFMKNCPDYLIAFYGIWYAGAAVVPINAKLHVREAAWIMKNAGARLAFATRDLAGDLDAATEGVDVIDTGQDRFADLSTGAPLAAPAARAPGDLAWLFYTSGTTGRPKGVCITHRMLTLMSLSYLADADAFTAEDAALYAAPMSHGAGIYNMIHVYMGARHVCPPSGGFDAAEVLDLSRVQGRLSMFMAPTMVRRLVDTARARGDKAPGIRTIIYGGGPMYRADIIEAVDWFGPKFVQIYGQGECPMCITALSRGEVADRSHPRWRERLGSVGRAQSVVELRIGDAEGKALAPGQVGEIMVRGDPVMPGYWQNPEASARALKDGWLLTGDMGFLDADGYLTLQDRSKDVIISGGTNIYPREVEEVLLGHPSVHEVAVVGGRDPEWGEIVVAFVVPVPGAVLDEAALDAHCLAQIARFKRPKAYFSVESLPKNNYGKVLKTELRQRLETRGSTTKR
ncbi:AMP-dependent synthetase [Maritimibacter sp. 55A14]|uniref:class I adenylate-forming enzyme family protein n=1 Tax=Maritimibacter sp. 55A14 TaxID=2174844 RepID=UPI000D61081C|nr:AMP-binding protein [Maritimibacter sp. 55A14]PWE33391.1 AMP-dependent synthetase [Maritimibacter sp. 55A14]